ncbi:MAG: phenylalanine--tRNA ligase subunit alpha [Patescibacteria group bacterium]|nr:phenylalanine--tRNA ligase subunit alpha [Patescibacteria group bacterium]
MDIKEIKNSAETEIKSAQNIAGFKEIFQKYLGKKGEITQVLRSLKNLSEKERKIKAKAVNELKKDLLIKIEKGKKKFQGKEVDSSKDWIDITAPGKRLSPGHLHPITQVKEEIEDIFERLGFSVIEGPEVETEKYNFDALNIPKNHPARDAWDTFWLKTTEKEKDKLLLRTHTSPVQIRYMEKYNPPLRIVVPGRVFRYEATDASHEINFYQIEGLIVDKEINVAHFKAIMGKFLEMFFKEPVKIRLRPSYFPFTEPSFEIDMKCLVCKGKGCSVCSKRGWLEMMGAGMVHREIFKVVKLNPKNWQGFAFGLGLDRLTMMKYKINDVRLLYRGDLKFLEQF